MRILVVGAGGVGSAGSVTFRSTAGAGRCARLLLSPLPPVLAYLPKNGAEWNGSFGLGKSPQYDPLAVCM